MPNKDERVIEEFGEEWTKFDYSNIEVQALQKNFHQYFSIFPWDILPHQPIGFDMGCGTGRWAQFVAPKVKTLNCIEPSDAIFIAKKNLDRNPNVVFHKETTEECSLAPKSQDFGYCLGVLHHVPDTQTALNDCIKLLKSGAPFLLYLYYDFENRPLWFKRLWIISDYIRRLISISPKPVKYFVVTLIALFVYFPLSRCANLLERIGVDVDGVPLSDYRNKSLYQMKNDSLDRFGTRLEQRFSKAQITEMLEIAGCKGIKFSPKMPFWCCLSYKK